MPSKTIFLDVPIDLGTAAYEEAWLLFLQEFKINSAEVTIFVNDDLREDAAELFKNKNVNSICIDECLEKAAWRIKFFNLKENCLFSVSSTGE